MRSIVIAITGASAMQLGERSIQLLLENNKQVDLILSRGAYEVWMSEEGIKIPGEPDKQERFWREKLDIKKGILKCHRWNDNSSNIASLAASTPNTL